MQVKKVMDSNRFDYCGGRMLPYDPSDSHFCCNFQNNFEIIPPKSIVVSGKISGCNMVFKRKVLERVGNFDPFIGVGTPFSDSDTDILARASKVGFTGAVIPELTVYHHHGRKPKSLELAKVIRFYDHGRGAYYLKRIFSGEFLYLFYWMRVTIGFHNIKFWDSFDERPCIIREIIGAFHYTYIRLKGGLPIVCSFFLQQKNNVHVLYNTFVSRKYSYHYFFYASFNMLASKVPFVKRLLFRKILQTRQMSCHPKADIEFHSLVSHNDCLMYLLAIKSFLRFFKDIAVIVHDDGTLNDSDKAILEAHIKDVSIISLQEADAKVLEALSSFSNCRYFRKIYPNAKQLFDYSLLSKTQRIFSFDSDLLFLKRPTEIISWIRNNSQTLIYHVETLLPHSDLFRKYRLEEVGNINIGFAGYNKQIIDFAVIEHALQKVIHEPGHTWKWSQGFFNLIAKKTNCPLQPLGEERYKAFLPTPETIKCYIKDREVMIHFFNYKRFYANTYCTLASKVIEHLLTSEE